MSPDEIYADLDRIAKHHGQLDADVVLGAAAILALPRYVASPDPAELLVDDLKRVIDAMPNYPDPQGKPKEAWSSYNFQGYARQYFSLDNPGATLSYRRMFGRKGDPGGSLVTWMNRGVLFRVAAGLLELQVADLASASQTLPNHAYRIESLRVVRRILGYREVGRPPGSVRTKFSFFPFTDTLEYNVRLVTPGPCQLVVPFPVRHTKLVGYDNRDQNLHPIITENGHYVPTLTFGMYREPGELLKIEVQHKPFVIYPSSPEPRSTHVVDQPTGQLILEVQAPGSDEDYEWCVLRSDMPVDEMSLSVDKPEWSCNNPHVGEDYQLCGFTPQ